MQRPIQERLRLALLQTNHVGLVLVSAAMILLAVLAGILVAQSTNDALPYIPEHNEWVAPDTLDPSNKDSQSVKAGALEVRNSSARKTVFAVTALLNRVRMEDYDSGPAPPFAASAAGIGKRFRLVLVPSPDRDPESPSQTNLPPGLFELNTTAFKRPLLVDDATEIRSNVVAVDRPQYERKSTPRPISALDNLLATYPDCPATGYYNPFPRGVCTWYIKEKRKDIPTFPGDSGLAANWAISAERCGFPVNERPAAGAIVVFPPGANGSDSGHVAYVEKVGSSYVLISECNVTHNAVWTVEPSWWEAGYACAHRRIFFDQLDPGVLFIHRRAEETGWGIRGLEQEF
jgi:surface antigen